MLDEARFRDRFLEATLVDVQMDGASTYGTVFPEGWESDGLALSRDDPRVVCPPSGG